MTQLIQNEAYILIYGNILVISDLDAFSSLKPEILSYSSLCPTPTPTQYQALCFAQNKSKKDLLPPTFPFFFSLLLWLPKGFKESLKFIDFSFPY